MKRILTLLFLFLFTNGLFAQTLVNQSVIASSLGTPPQYYSYIKGLPLPAGGFALLYNVYITGQQEDFLLVEMDATGNTIGIADYNSLHNGKDFGTNLYTKGNYVYAVGFTMDSTGKNSLTFNTMKIDISTWDTLWTRSENIDSGIGEMPVSVLADDSGNVYVGGTVQTLTDNHMAVVKYAPNGTKLWTTRYNGTYTYTSAVSMALSGRFINATGFSFDGSGHSNFVTAGFDKYTGTFWDDKIDSGGSGMISHPVNIATDQQANSYISGSFTISGIKSVIKTVSYDTAFNQLWVSAWGDSSQTNTASGMVVDVLGLNQNIFITGSNVNASGQHSMVVLRYTMDGTLQWAKTINTGKPTDGVAITTDNMGNSYATGTQYNGVDTDIVTLALDSSGNIIWQKIFNSAIGANDAPYSILMGGSNPNSVIVTERSAGSGTDYKLIEYDQWQPTPCGDTICPTITYSFGTGTVTTAGIDTFIEFDIYAKQNEPSLAYYGGNIIFTYGKDVFGNSIVDSNHIVITRGTIISDTNYMYSLKDTIYKSDALPPNGGEILLSIAPHSSSGLFAIADTFQQLCHIKMKRERSGNFQVSFDQFFMENQSQYLNGDLFNYNLVNAIGSLISAPVASCPTPTLTYTVENISCGPNGYTFDITYRCTLDVPIADMGFVISWDNTQANYAADVSPTWWGNQYAAGVNTGIAIYQTTTDINFVNAGLGYLQMQANTDANYDPTDANVQHTSSNPSTGVRYANIGLSYVVGVTIPTAINFAMGFNTTGVGGVAVTNDFGCNGTSGITILPFNTVANKTNQVFQLQCSGDAIHNLSEWMSSINVYPNPFSNKISLQYQLTKDAIVSIQIQDILGRYIYSQSETDMSSGQHQMEIKLPNELSTGLYLLKIRVANAETTLKIIKE